MDTRAPQDIPQMIREMRQNWHVSEEIRSLLDEGIEHDRKILRRLEEPREILRRLEERIEHEGDGFLRRLLTLRGMVFNRASVEAFILGDILISKIIADFADQDAEESPRWRERHRSLIEIEFPNMAKNRLSAAKSAAERAEALKWISETEMELPSPPSEEVLPGRRSDFNGSRALRIFVERLWPSIKQATGRWCDPEVAILAQIVFGRRDIDADNIRKLRSPTTRAGRKASARVRQEMPDL
jgi:hypothetical protein